MTRRRNDLTHQPFGRLYVTSPAKSRGGRTYWYTVCACGTEKVVATDSLVSGNVRSCGCLRRETSRETTLRNIRLGAIARYRRARAEAARAAQKMTQAPTWRGARDAVRDLESVWK